MPSLSSAIKSFMKKIVKHGKDGDKKKNYDTPTKFKESLDEVLSDIEKGDKSEEELIRRNSGVTITSAMDCCQQILGSNLIEASPEVKEIEKEYDGGTDFHKKVQRFARSRNKDIEDDDDDSFNGLRSIVATSVEVCKRLACKERKRCNLQFLFDGSCVWSVLFENINNVRHVSYIIYSISKYMEASEKETENKFTF